MRQTPFWKPITPETGPLLRACSQLGRFDGVLQVDGYGAYKSLARRRRKSNAAPLRLAFCLAHARRKFALVVKTTGSKEALAVIGMIAEVYRIESRIRGLSAEARLSARQAESAALMTALKARLERLMADVSAKSSIGKAAAYTLGHWEGLTAFLGDGRIEVDSNIVERSIKPVCLTRKNALFAAFTGIVEDDEKIRGIFSNEERPGGWRKRGGETWAILASLVNTAKLNDIDPGLWLADVSERIVSGTTTINRLDTLLPWNWKAERAAPTPGEVLAA